MKLLRALLTRLILVLAGIVFAGAVGEVITRLALPPRRNVVTLSHDARFGFVHSSDRNAVTYAWGDGEAWRYRTNSRGFRGSDWPDHPAPERRRVLVMGDSFTFGNGVEEQYTYPSVASGLLKSSSIEFINAGISGWGPQNALAYLETEGSTIRADCLVYGFFEGNDVIDGLVSRLYSLRAGQAVRNPPFDGRDRAARIDGAMSQLPGYSSLLIHSQLFNVMRSVTLHRVARLDPHNRPQFLYHQIAPNDLEAALNLNDATMTRMAELAQRRFGAMGVLLIPMRGQLTDAPDANALPFPRDVAERSHERMVTWGAQQEVPILSLRDHFMHRNPTDNLYFTKDFHLSVLGNRVVGEVLAARINSLCGEIARSVRPPNASSVDAQPIQR